MISSGCDIPPASRWENIDAFFAAVQAYLCVTRRDPSVRQVWAADARAFLMPIRRRNVCHTKMTPVPARRRHSRVPPVFPALSSDGASMHCGWYRLLRMTGAAAPWQGAACARFLQPIWRLGARTSNETPLTRHRFAKCPLKTHCQRFYFLIERPFAVLR